MRIFSAACLTLLVSGMAFGQTPAVRGYAGSVYGPYVPMVTTPQVSLQTVSPAPVGASDATYGLAAGARNSTLSTIEGNTSSTYTKAVWYSGGAPLVSEQEVSLFPQGLHHGVVHPREMRMEEARREHAEAGPRTWTYYAAEEETSNAAEVAAAAKGGRKASRTYTNQDTDRQNQTNGSVKYDGKTEKLQ